MTDFLLEIYGEEIPPQSQIEGKKILYEIFLNFFNQRKIKFGKIEIFSTARRLIVIVSNLPRETDIEIKKLRGPSKSANKTAIDGFLGANKLKSINNLIIEEIKGKEYFFLVKELPPEKLDKILSNFIPQALKSFGWKKSMRWGDNKDKWIRPIKKILCIFGEEIVKFNFADINSTSTTTGNYLYSSKDKKIKSISEYKTYLDDNNVVIEDTSRKDIILSKLGDICKKFNLKINSDQKLINEVSNLVENPNVLWGKFDKSFFSMPENFLVTVLSDQQKYFSFKDKENNLSDVFAFISNHYEDKNNIIRKGNERVLHARFKDALFFIKEDSSCQLEDRLEKLEKVTYFENLGNLKDKSFRISKIAEIVAETLKLPLTINQKKVLLLLKTDLTTEMVKEFPSLQGYVGSYYAKLQGFNEEEYKVMEDQYLPNPTNDNIPTSKFSVCVAIAEKVDNINAAFLVGKKPTGSKDPYSLRRSALGIIRLVIESNIDINITEIFLESRDLFKYKPLSTIVENQEILNFIMTRLTSYFKEIKISGDVINSIVINNKELNPNLLLKKSKQIIDFRKKKNGQDFISSYKRVESILSNNKFNNSINVGLFKSSEEKKLYSYIVELDQLFNQCFIDSNYSECIEKLFGLTKIINNFFDKIKVHSEIKEEKINRINLLFFLKHTVDKVCDFSKLEKL